jgi:hypothetical protein
MQASAEVRAKASSAAAVATSKKLGQRRVLDQSPGDADAFVEADEVRAGEDVHFVAGGFEHRAQEGAGRSLAVGPGDVKDGCKTILRPAQPLEQCGDTLQAEAVASR